MSKYNSIYVWDNVDNIIHIIESIIGFNYHTIDLYDMKYCSKEDYDCSHQSENGIRKLVKMKKPFGVGYMFKSNCYSINERLSKFQGLCQSRISQKRYIFPTFRNDFFPSSKMSNLMVNWLFII